MSEGNGGQSLLASAGGISLFIGFVSMAFAPGLGFTCCLFGVFGLVASAITGAADRSESGKMTLQQGSDGQWNWVANSIEPQGQIAQAGAAQYNDLDSQVLTRVISEVRGGSKLEELEIEELETLGNAYGIHGGSKQQRIDALRNSNLASKALKLSAVGAVGGLGALGASKIVKKGRERAIERAEELREQGREKLQENIDKGRYKIDSSLPTNADGETATEAAHNVILDQLRNQIKQRNLTPAMLLEIGDTNGDGKLSVDEISIVMSKITGIAIPAFIVKDSIKDFDLNEDGSLDHSELNHLWNQLGFETEEHNEDEEFAEIDSMMEEIDIQDNGITGEGHSGPQQIIHISDGTEKVIQLDGKFLVGGNLLGVGQWISETRFAVLVEEWGGIWWVGQLTEGGMLTATVNTANETLDVIPNHFEGWVAEVEDAVSEETEDNVKSGKNGTNTELTDGIDTEFEEFIVKLESARLSSERREIMKQQSSDYLVNIKISKMERTLIGDPQYRGGQSVHGLLDGGPYEGLVKIPVEFNDKILECKKGDEINVSAKLVDFSSSLKRSVLEARELL
tara:strand:+ start:14792 stop:16495 length:1704 start_codon:yes stop_codon:yes gene_type:complete